MSSQDNLIPRTGTQGWKQFLTSKEAMLGAFDRARTHAKAHEVETYHGRVAEGAFRDWLAGFLPKRYGVTPGYIVSQGVRGDTKLPHYDVIIFDQLEAPVLWVEDNPDSSSGGMSRAIPAEHVRSVIEVKASLNPRDAKHALDHLDDLNPLLAGVDVPGERYKKYLPEMFFSAAVFFELRQEYEFSEASLRHLIPRPCARPWPHFIGGLILRGEGLPPDYSGGFNSIHGDPLPPSAQQVSILRKCPMPESVTHPSGLHWSVFLMFGTHSYAMFAFDLIARLNQTYRAGMMSSMHGMNWMGTT